MNLSDPPPTPQLIDGAPEWDGRIWVLKTDIYGAVAYPGLDGINVWPLLTKAPMVTPAQRLLSTEGTPPPPVAPSVRDAAHPTLVLSQEAIISGQYKLITAYSGFTGQGYNRNIDGTGGSLLGWKYPNGTIDKPGLGEQRCGLVNNTNCPGVNCSWASTIFVPCLFDLDADPRETTDLSATLPAVRDRLWSALNATRLTYYHARSPAALLGTCNESCATKHWGSFGGYWGPICGVVGCGDPPSMQRGRADPEALLPQEHGKVYDLSSMVRS